MTTPQPARDSGFTACGMIMPSVLLPGGLPQPRYCRATGMDFAYLEADTTAGKGPLVLCLHGFPDTAWSMADLVRRLAAAGFRAVAPFMRGYPPGAIPDDRDYSALALGRDV